MYSMYAFLLLNSPKNCQTFFFQKAPIMFFSHINTEFFSPKMCRNFHETPMLYTCHSFYFILSYVEHDKKFIENDKNFISLGPGQKSLMVGFYMMGLIGSVLEGDNSMGYFMLSTI